MSLPDEDPGRRFSPPRAYGVPEVPAPTGPEAAAFDAAAIAGGVPRTTLMENAGRSAARIVDRLFPEGRVVAVVGSGHNGGDALVLLRTLAAWGRPVSAVLAGSRPGEPAEDALLHGWKLSLLEPDSDPDAYDEALFDAAVVVDGILGTGMKGPPRARQAVAIDAVNRSRCPVIALDVASGIDSETGAVPAEAIHADVTIAFGFPKLGSLLHPARGRGGRIIAVEIGFPPPSPESSPFGARLISAGWATAHRPQRDLDTHKNQVGALLLLAGGTGMAGAAILAARAAFRAGAGLVRVASAPENRVILQTAVPEAIFVDRTDTGALEEAVGSSRAVAAGPGMGTDGAAADALRVVIEAATGSELALLLDADALNLVASGIRLPARDGGAERVLLTPHVGEMSRLTSRSHLEIQSRRPDAARDFAADSGCTVLLKGTPSLVASPRRGLLVDTAGSTDLATAGMGDVLTGAAAGFLAQGSPVEVAAGLGLHHCGRAAALAAKGAGLIPSDVIERLPDALGEKGNGVSDLDLPYLLLDQEAPR